MHVSDYKMDFKSMMFFASCQGHFELLFYFSYTFVVECSEV